uniref:Nitrogen fixation protein FixH n=1 Tax=Candidatus Kentrum sp. FM TaxID=2126340 RepID=A0A450X5Y3_9GAMM|nr:MAG: Nitrogen fixation protein FixH [Candidatus Kentron sp. FM]
MFIILCANATMIYLAMDTNPGLVVVDYYDRGQNYERTVLSRQALSRKLSLQLDVPPEIRQGEPATFRFTGADNGGRPIEPDAVTLYAYRPSNCAHDFSLPMTKTAPVTKDGEDPYLTRATFPLQGVWDIVIAVEQDGIEHHVARRVTVATTR